MAFPVKNESDKIPSKDKMDGHDKSYKAIMLSGKGCKKCGSGKCSCKGGKK